MMYALTNVGDGCIIDMLCTTTWVLMAQILGLVSRPAFDEVTRYILKGNSCWVDSVDLWEPGKLGRPVCSYLT